MLIIAFSSSYLSFVKNFLCKLAPCRSYLSEIKLPNGVPHSCWPHDKQARLVHSRHDASERTTRVVNTIIIDHKSPVARHAGTCFGDVISCHDSRSKNGSFPWS